MSEQQISVCSRRLRAVARTFLRKKGCGIEEREDGYEQITFPVGTVRQGSAGCRGTFLQSVGELRFPDGTVIEELVDADCSYLQLPREAFGEEYCI